MQNTTFSLRRLAGLEGKSLEPHTLVDIAMPRQVLIVCTANQCRSAAAALLLSDMLERTDVSVKVVSSGTDALYNVAALPDTIAAMKELGYDLSQHRSLPVSFPMLTESDLILGMTRHHVLTLLDTWPPGTSRVRLFKPYCEGRPDVLQDATDDIADPVGKPIEAHRQCVRQLFDLLTLLVERWTRA